MKTKIQTDIGISGGPITRSNTKALDPCWHLISVSKLLSQHLKNKGPAANDASAGNEGQ